MGGPVPLTTEDWARIRYEYESTGRTVADICAERSISDGTLRDRVRRWGWKRRSSGPVPREGPPPMAVSIIQSQPPEGSHAEVLAEAKEEKGDPPGDIDELRADLKRQIDAIIAEEREARPRRYLAAWEEFAAQAAKPAPHDAEPSVCERAASTRNVAKRRPAPSDYRYRNSSLPTPTARLAPVCRSSDTG